MTFVGPIRYHVGSAQFRTPLRKRALRPVEHLLPATSAQGGVMSETWRDPEAIEAEIRRAMAEHASIRPRGFDTIARRAALHHSIDALLDELAVIAPRLAPEVGA